MSAINFAVLFAARSVSGRLACGVLRPQLRWSKRTTRYALGSKNRRNQGEQPEPGPPCKTTAGFPLGLPAVSQ
jgi:hypothetical protein